MSLRSIIGLVCVRFLGLLKHALLNGSQRGAPGKECMQIQLWASGVLMPNSLLGETAQTMLFAFCVQNTISQMLNRPGVHGQIGVHAQLIVIRWQHSTALDPANPFPSNAMAKLSRAGHVKGHLAQAVICIV